ncbi:hypothetical protein XENOCAPTIV_001312 [Xenoophorus captivus]|uniref:Uncharacterized protein n=1 Tax=Xenoophorus captivus TaxID=1517983 RepID=A0ABV0S6E4_9TELE
MPMLTRTRSDVIARLFFPRHWYFLAHLIVFIALLQTQTHTHTHQTLNTNLHTRTHIYGAAKSTTCLKQWSLLQRQMNAGFCSLNWSGFGSGDSGDEADFIDGIDPSYDMYVYVSEENTNAKENIQLNELHSVIIIILCTSWTHLSHCNVFCVLCL